MMQPWPVSGTRGFEAVDVALVWIETSVVIEHSIDNFKNPLEAHTILLRLLNMLKTFEDIKLFRDPPSASKTLNLLLLREGLGMNLT